MRSAPRPRLVTARGVQASSHAEEFVAEVGHQAEAPAECVNVTVQRLARGHPAPLDLADPALANSGWPPGPGSGCGGGGGSRPAASRAPRPASAPCPLRILLALRSERPPRPCSPPSATTPAACSRPIRSICSSRICDHLVKVIGPPPSCARSFRNISSTCSARGIACRYHCRELPDLSPATSRIAERHGSKAKETRSSLRAADPGPQFLEVLDGALFDMID
jgi:hypothetical protein